MTAAKKKKVKKPKSFAREWIDAILWAAGAYFLISTFLVQGYKIPSASMENTLLIGDMLFANKFIFGAKIPFTSIKLPGIRNPKRGDIVIFTDPQTSSRDLVKRCIGVPGDKVEVKDNHVYVNGEKINEPYVNIKGFPNPRADFGPINVPTGKYFMLGDNRNNSADSRYWGLLDEKLIKGKVWVVYWSWDNDNHLPRWKRTLNFPK